MVNPMTTDSGIAGAGRARRNPARQASLREHNLSVVLAEIAHRTAPPSRADIAQTTGLTKTTVSALADQLIQAGLVTELPLVRSLRAGRPAQPLVPAAGSLAAVGLEVNVDYLGIRVLDLAGNVLVERVDQGDYRNSAPGVVLSRLADIYGAAIATLGEMPVAGVCVALPGLVDAGTGPLRIAPNLGWQDVDVVQILGSVEDLGSIPVTLANEATLAAQAESEALRDNGVQSFFYVSGEIGIGGAIVTEGELAPGRHGWSGEIGHTLVDPAGPRCGCGANGCLEQYAGKDAMLSRAGLTVDDSIEALVRLLGAGSDAARVAVDAAGSALGVALANAINVLDVDTVVLGGIYAPLCEHLTAGIAAQLQMRVLWQPWAPVQIRAAHDTDYPALTGAALTVLATVLSDPSSWIESRSPGIHLIVQDG
jgi:predicted NBD/HSP70 family sugar kinase